MSLIVKCMMCSESSGKGCGDSGGGNVGDDDGGGGVGGQEINHQFKLLHPKHCQHDK